MANIFNEGFKEFIEALNKHDVGYILIGGHSVILRGYSRVTGDMDISMGTILMKKYCTIFSFQILLYFIFIPTGMAQFNWQEL